MPSTLSRLAARGDGCGAARVERGVRYSRKDEGKSSGRISWLGRNLRASALGVSSVWMKIVRFACGWEKSGVRGVCVAGLWRRVEGDNEVAMGACEKLRVVVAANLCVLAVVDELIVGRERALVRHRVADLEAMVVVLCEECDCWVYKCSTRSRKVHVAVSRRLTQQK
jgi:hypothetical protein